MSIPGIIGCSHKICTYQNGFVNGSLFAYSTDKMSTFAPRTLLRLYNPDKTAHVTGVVLKDGRIYETTGRKTYDSFDQWNTERDQGGNMTIDASKAEGVIISDDWKGFINSKGYTPHTDWIYEMMLEYTPHLLEREDIRNAFNHYQSVYADLLRKRDIHTSRYYIGKGQIDLTEPSETTIPAGYMHAYTTPSRKRISTEFMNAYKPLYDLISAELLPHLTVRSKKYKQKKIASRKRYLIGVAQRRIEKYKKSIADAERMIEYLKAELAIM